MSKGIDTRGMSLDFGLQIIKLEGEIERYSELKEAAVKKRDYYTAAMWRDHVNDLKKQLARVQLQERQSRIDK